jgi:GntP family gluconate:H+ symporter
METTFTHWPVFVLLIGIAIVIILITVTRVHAFLSLMLAAIVVGLLSKELPQEELTSHLIQAVELSMTEFGVIAGRIAFIIAMASILGVALTQSGAAERIVIKFVNLFGERYAPIALVLSGFILSVPVFFDTVFFLLIPIAQSMGRRMKKNYMVYVLAICVGAAITHSLVPPTPGPLIMAETMQLNLGLVITAGLIAGILPTIAGYIFTLRIGPGFNVVPPVFQTEEEGKSDEPAPLPSFFLSMLPIAVPIFLIIFASANEFLAPQESRETILWRFIGFIGNKNVAMLAGTFLALWLVAKQKKWSLKKLGQSMEKPLEIAGIIILITSAGGAFGGMIRYSGIGDWIQEMANAGFQVNYILLAWFIAALMKFAQGSGTVSMITTAGIMYSILGSVTLPYHPVYILMAMGFGSLTLSWMNDSGFWVVCKLSGFTETQTLKSWTAALVVMSIVGLIQTFILAQVVPLV